MKHAIAILIFLLATCGFGRADDAVHFKTVDIYVDAGG